MANRAACVLLVAVGLGVLLPMSPAEAHVRSSAGYSEIRSAGDGDVSYELHLEYELLARAAGLDDVEGSPVSVLEAGRRDVAAYLSPRVGILVDGAACAGEVEDAAVEERQDVAYARLTLAYACPGSSTGSYRVSYQVFSDGDAVVDDHTNIVDYDLGGHRGRVVLDAGHRAFTAGSGGVLTSTSRFVRLGVEHIFGGIDHVLFVVALLLGARSVTSVVKVASAFTAAHSVTLALAALGWVEVPSEIVEPLIALSIAYVAAENLLGGASPHRVAVVFGFGLLHGLGFASGLQLTGDMSWAVVTSLVGFNVGVELGQGLLIAVLFPTLLALRRLQWSPLAHAGATAVLAVVGLTWFFQRITFR